MREIQLLRSSSKLCSVFLHGYWQNELTGEHACVRVIRWIQICPAINHALHSYWLAYRRGMLWLVTGQGIRYVDANQTIDNEVTFLIVLSIVHINNDWNCMDDHWGMIMKRALRTFNLRVSQKSPLYRNQFFKFVVKRAFIWELHEWFMNADKSIDNNT
jgi:hypothetical protein